ncbi:(R)-mandelonitrile lyase-like [Ricinus communis]|uniref:(R)-mandelonitrile lyase-like n=1 Tax=Ricinus communis TaxID=3988 RepID=UPI00201AE614|nr:(R)-mandelonitrile lyase-like [Ricinus communis]
MTHFFYYYSALLFIIIFIAPVSHARPHPQPDPSYQEFVVNATDLPSEDYYDYIIVGGGTAGCPLAATLSQSYRVLLLERGGVPYSKPNVMTQEGFLATLTEVNTFDSPAQSFTSEDGVPNARGRILGGSSAINAGFYSRADTEFFRQSGVNWDMRVVNQSYDWIEKAIVFRPELRNWQSAVRDGLLEAGVDPYNGFSLDHLMGTKISGSTFDGSGRRHSSADLLNYANARNIKVAVHASVERILLASTSFSRSKITAIGVVYRDQRGHYHHAMVHDNGEVILSAGAIGSPQMLLLSGIGPRPYLSTWGIPVAYHLPYVGQYLYDNPRNGISIVPSIPLEHSLIQVVGITDVGAYLEAASNVIPFASPARSVFIRPPFAPLYLTVATLMEKITGPLSTGSLRLASTDVRVNPIVRFNYFSHPLDVEKCVNGTRKIGDVLRSRSMEDFRFHEWFGARNFRFVGPALPIDQSDFLQMADFCHRTVSTIWHYHGGCVVGKVVDRDYRVLGVGSLRVVDGSTFTVSPGTNPQATVMMLGRYIGLKIINERTKYK